MATFDRNERTDTPGSGTGGAGGQDGFQLGPGMERLLTLLSDPQPSAHEIAQHLDAMAGREWNDMVQLLQRRMGNAFTDEVVQQTRLFERHRTPEGW